MAAVFISWSKDDEAVVTPVVQRLRAYGWSVYFSGDNSEAGQIDENVVMAIEQASVMVLFISQRTNEKPWLKRECEWAASARARQTVAGVRRPLRLIPLLIGDVDLAKLNSFLARDQMNLRTQIPPPVPLVPGEAFSDSEGLTLQMPAGSLSEENLRAVVGRVHSSLGAAPPIVIPTLLLAMTDQQAAAHLDAQANQPLIESLCRSQGMRSFPELRAELLTRYGAMPEDFAPFGAAQTLKELLEEARGALNAGLPEQASPLELWWCREDFTPGHANWKFLIERMSHGPLLVVLDSISAQHPHIIQQYNRVSATHQSGPSALLWVPPYTAHTNGLRDLWETALELEPSLLARFNTWGKSAPEPPVLFDIGTAETLRAWSLNALRTLGTQTQTGESRQQRLKTAGARPTTLVGMQSAFVR